MDVLFLLDANVLLTAHNSYYPVDRVPEFWAWLKHLGEADRAKIPLECFEEVKFGRKGNESDPDPLFAWVQDLENKRSIVLAEQVSITRVQTVLTKGYAHDLTDIELEEIGRDPFLIAYGLAAPEVRCVVTTETSAPSKTRHNRRIPDVCNALGVRCCDTFSFLRALDFRTGWKL